MDSDDEDGDVDGDDAADDGDAAGWDDDDDDEKVDTERHCIPHSAFEGEEAACRPRYMHISATSSFRHCSCSCCCCGKILPRSNSMNPPHVRSPK